MERLNFNVLLPEDGRPLVLLQWFDFEYELIQDVIDLMEFAEREGLLEHKLVIDVTDSGGGSRGAYAIQRLVDRPFRTTFGNIRLSDAGEGFGRRWSEADDSRQMKSFTDTNQAAMAEDHDGAPVFLARNAWHLSRTGEDWPAIRFLKTREHGVV